jgi:hypothetical protein
MHRDRRTLRVGVLIAALACSRPDAAPPAATHAVTDSTLAATLTTDRPAYAPGHSVTLRLVLRNVSAAPVTIAFSSGQRYDFAIEDTRAPMWRWSASQMFAQVLGEETLAAGDSLVYSEQFKGELPAGPYRAVGTVVRMGEPVTATAEFQIR